MTNIVVFVRGGIVQDVLSTEDAPGVVVYVADFDVENEDDAIKVKWPNGVEELARIYEEVPIKHPDAQVIVDTGAL